MSGSGKDDASLLARNIMLLAMLGGFALLLLAFVYDVLFAGLPYQDPPPDLQAAYELRRAVAAVLAWSGALFVAAGGLALLVRYLRHRHRRRCV